MTDCQRVDRTRQDGFAAVAMLLVLVPTVLVVGTFLQTMNSRSARLQSELHDEQALQTAESGIDWIIYETKVAGTTSVGTRFEERLDSGSSFQASVTYHYGSDGFDDDRDGTPDDPDEDVFQVTSTGTVGTATRRVVAYMARRSYLPSLTGSVTLTHPSPTIDLSGSARIDGRNYNFNGTLAASGSTYGIAMAPPGTAAHGLAELTGSEPSKVNGVGGTPSVGPGIAINIAELINQARNSATIVVNRENVSSSTFGTTAAPVVTYRNGDVRLAGNCSGAGLMVVEGNLTITGNFTYYGVIVVTGTVDTSLGTTMVYGGMVMGPNTSVIDLRGTCDLRYSALGVAMASALAGRYVTFNGWQETPIH
jgi:hypothetical protein